MSSTLDLPIEHIQHNVSTGETIYTLDQETLHFLDQQIIANSKRTNITFSKQIVLQI